MYSHGVLHSAHHRACQHRCYYTQGITPNSRMHYRRCFGPDLFDLADPEIRDFRHVSSDRVLFPESDSQREQAELEIGSRLAGIAAFQEPPKFLSLVLKQWISVDVLARLLAKSRCRSSLIYTNSS